MQKRRVGTTGLEVSALALGTMTWSRDTDAQEAGEQLDLFLDAGGTLIDTAASYADGGRGASMGLRHPPLRSGARCDACRGAYADVW